jgi:trehalose 6-phosphate phosphatase
MGSYRCPGYLFDYIGELSEKISGSRYVFLFLDYDGTLSPIPRRRIKLERPLSQYTRDLLASLSSSGRVRISIVSGRSVDTLKRLIGLDDILYVGAHGHIIEGPGIRFTHCIAERLSSVIDKALGEIREKIQIVGAVIEDKEITFSIHYRGVKRENVNIIKSILRDVALRYYGLKIKRGKSIFEVLPDTGWDKGKAVEYVLAMLAMNIGDGLPIYIGDDTSDENAFKAVNMRGISVKVGGSCRTRAKYYVRDVGDVERFLAWLGKIVGKNS